MSERFRSQARMVVEETYDQVPFMVHPARFVLAGRVGSVTPLPVSLAAASPVPHRGYCGRRRLTSRMGSGYAAIAIGARRILDRAPAGDQLDAKYRNGDDQQDMNKTAQGV
jgi:hypothetical protein